MNHQDYKKCTGVCLIFVLQCPDLATANHSLHDLANHGYFGKPAIPKLKVTSRSLLPQHIYLIATKHSTAYQIANWRSDNPRSTNLLPQSSVPILVQGFACPATSKPSSPPSTTSQSPLSTPTQWVRWISPHTSPDCQCARAIWTRAVSELHRHCPDTTVYIYIQRPN